MDNTEYSLPSPCIGHCCLDDDDICVGCKRHIEEITGWHSASNERKVAILKRCIERGNRHIKLQGKL